MAAKKPKIVYDGKYIRMVDRNGWEYASRKNLTGIVGVIGVTDRNELLLIEQFRPPVNKQVIEIPAGLAGDLKGSRNEELAKAARRELFEETGYTCKALSQKGLEWIDVWESFLDPDGKPREDLFQKDRLHNNVEGNKLYADAVRPHLK
jgi:8-oxo-dGTP pyrophosphatase MutT (NUDIX family)